MLTKPKVSYAVCIKIAFKNFSLKVLLFCFIKLLFCSLGWTSLYALYFSIDGPLGSKSSVLIVFLFNQPKHVFYLWISACCLWENHFCPFFRKYFWYVVVVFLSFLKLTFNGLFLVTHFRLESNLFSYVIFSFLRVEIYKIRI